MSEMSRSRLYELNREKLKIEEHEWQFIKQHIADFCINSDLKVKEKFGETANEDEILSKEKMSEEEFIEFAREIVIEILERYGVRKGRKRLAQSDDQMSDDSNIIYAQQGEAMRQQHCEECRIQEHV